MKKPKLGKKPWAFRRRWTDKQKLDGEELPKWYGVGYWNPVINVTYCYPIPFHLLVRLGHRLSVWFHLQFKIAYWMKDPYDWIYRAGFKDGKETHERNIQRVDQALLESVIREIVAEEKRKKNE